jgi:hypothetical protein
MNLIASIIFLMTYTPASRTIEDPCDNIRSLEMAMGCSTVNQARVYSDHKLNILAGSQ